MASDAAIKESLEFHKDALAGVLGILLEYDWRRIEGFNNDFTKFLGCNPTSLEDAAQFFGLDHTRESHREILLLLLAQAVFGKKTRGPKRGGKTLTWSHGRKFILGYLSGELSHQNPNWSNEKIAAVICEKIGEFKAYRRDPRAVRKQLPAARREFERFLFIKALSGGSSSRT
jgi:hypothetical protein